MKIMKQLPAIRSTLRKTTKCLVDGSLGSGRALFAGVGNAHATLYFWTNSVPDNWQSTTAWAPAGNFPVTGDSVNFTNNSAVTVVLTNDVVGIVTNLIGNVSGRTA